MEESGLWGLQGSSQSIRPVIGFSLLQDHVNLGP